MKWPAMAPGRVAESEEVVKLFCYLSLTNIACGTILFENLNNGGGMYEFYAAYVFFPKIVTYRDAIRKHRDEKGDNRCWLDDFRLYKKTINENLVMITLPPQEEMMRRCTEFHMYRRADAPDSVPFDAIVDPKKWNDDINAIAPADLHIEFKKIEAAIKKHHDIVDRPRTIQDDRALYAVLPEKVPADFRLPSREEFLGTAKPGAGCPAFWDSHQQCSFRNNCDVHSWGPCK